MAPRRLTLDGTPPTYSVICETSRRRERTVEAAMLIGGEWRRAAAGAEIEVVTPATEDVVGSVPGGGTEDVELAVETAKRAFPEWSATDVEHRAGTLSKAAALIEERAK